MNPVLVRDVIIGEGIPKICVPIVEKTKEEILRFAESLEDKVFDFVEWRADWYEDVYEFDMSVEIIDELQDMLDVPILYTFRTTKEGGATPMSASQYRSMINYIVSNSSVDMIDIEVFAFPNYAKELIDNAHNNAVIVVGSNHDFKNTPPQEEIVRKLVHMQTLGADIAKMAVMPKDKNDVLTLLAATEEMHLLHDDTPVITMSMGPLGVISRFSGEIFGSAVSFGSVGKTSAPGQMDSADLYDMMEILHKSIGGDL